VRRGELRARRDHGAVGVLAEVGVEDDLDTGGLDPPLHPRDVSRVYEAGIRHEKRLTEADVTGEPAGPFHRSPAEDHPRPRLKIERDHVK